MKILHLISGGDTGGAKTHVLTLLTRLKKIGVEVELLCIMEGVFTKEATELGIPVTIFPQKKRYDLKALKKIKDYINSSDCDLVHCHGARANYIAMFIRYGCLKPMLTTLHSDYKLDFKDSWYKQMVFAPINAVALRSFNYILTVTSVFKQMLIDRGFDEKKLYVIYNGIDFDKPNNYCSKKEFFQKYNIPYEADCKYVGIAARFQVVKGVIYFLEAAAEICKENPKARFLVAGDGDLKEEFKQFIKDRALEDKIFLLGFVQDINSFYNAIDVNTLTSLSESFPYALLEGAKMKKATVAAEVGGIVEMIRDKETGYLFEKANSNQLAKRINQLLIDDELRDSFGKAFYNYAKENFSAEKMALTHREIYEKIIHSQRP